MEALRCAWCPNPRAWRSCRIPASETYLRAWPALAGRSGGRQAPHRRSGASGRSGGCSDPADEAVACLVNDGRPTHTVDYAKHELLVAQDGEDIVAMSSSEGIAYRSTPSSGRLVLAGIDVQPLALAAARIAREAIRGQLLRDGWAVLHSSAVVRPEDGATLLTLGGKGAGKTTTALLLASCGWQLLANDRVWVRPSGEKGVEVVPWPSAAAVGLGLLHSLGWDVTAREQLQKGAASTRLSTSR